MNFFKAVFSDDSPPSPSAVHEEESDSIQSSNSNNSPWNLGGLFNTLASKSESVIVAYRRDLEEFSSELKKETAIIRDAASRAVMNLPDSLDVGASVAQESLESVGQAIDEVGSSVWKSTTQIISHGRDSLLAADSDFSDPSDSNNNSNNITDNHYQPLRSSAIPISDVKRYNRFDALVRALQSDVNTYLVEPEDLENYNEWKKLGFKLDQKGQEIQDLIEENEMIGEIYCNIVPSRTDHESFWGSYFYRLHRLNEAESARAKLVKRAISGHEEEEDLSWDFDDDGDGSGYEPIGNSRDGEVKKDLEIENRSKGETVSESGDNVKYHDQLASSEVKTDNNSESCKDSDISIVSSQPSMPEEEEDLGWDEIEDIGSNDEIIKGDDTVGTTTSRIDLQKRLSSAEQEEELNWDVEDDDDDDEEAVKS